MIDTEVVSLFPFAFRMQEPPVGLREQGEKLVLVYIYDQNNLGGERKYLSFVVLCVFDAVWGCSKENIINQRAALCVWT